MNQNGVLASVIIATYNHDKFIAQTIDSILGQIVNFKIEIIIADDCSNDNTPVILQEYQKKHPGIITLILSDRNEGAYKNGLKAYKAGKGKYVTWLDGDDYWAYDKKLQTQVDFLQANENYLGCFHDAKIIHALDINGMAKNQSQSEFKFYSQFNVYHAEFYPWHLLKRNLIPTASLVFRNQIPLDGLPCYDPRCLSLNWALHLMIIKGGKFRYFNEVWSGYNDHPGGVSKKASLNTFKLSNAAILKSLLNDDYYKNLKRDIYESMAHEYLQIILNPETANSQRSFLFKTRLRYLAACLKASRILIRRRDEALPRLYLKYIITVVGVVLAGVHVFLFAMGVGSIIGTFLLLACTLFLCISCLKILGKFFSFERPVLTNIRLMLISFIILWAGAELFLRYGLKKYAGYSEKNGEFLYVSPYTVKESDWSPVWQKNLHVYKPNYQASLNFAEYTYHIQVNSEGLREAEIPVPNPHSDYRILAMGDSFTEGRGAVQDSTWPKSLERKLNAMAGGRKTRVVNAGISGSDPFFEYQLLKERLLKYNPNMVIVAINSSDIDDLVIRGGMERFQPGDILKYKDGPWWTWLYANSFVFRHFIHDVFGYDWLFLKKEEVEGKRKEAKEQILTCIRLFEGLAKKNEFELMVVFHPTLEELTLKKSELSEVIKNSFNEKNVMVLDLYDKFINNKTIDALHQFYWKTDLHHNARGYDVFGDEVAKEIMNLGIFN